MKTILVFASLIVANLAAIAEVKLLKQQHNLGHVTRELLEFQKDILRLFRNIHLHDYYRDQVDIAEHYDIEDNIDNYNDQQVVKEFWELNQLGFLPKEDFFSIFNYDHRREAIALFNILYQAKDLPTFYKTACWARIFMNEQLFIYSLSVALVQRPDTAMIELPPIYEIYPEFFFNADVIQEAQRARQMFKGQINNMPIEEESQVATPMNVPPQMTYRQLYKRPRRAVFGLPEELLGKQISPPWNPYPWYNFFPGHMTMPPRHMMEPGRYMAKQATPSQPIPEPPMASEYLPEKMSKEQMMNAAVEKNVRKNMMDFSRFVGITVNANYSMPHNENDMELMMSYFTEDVGLNAYYYYYNIYFPFWLPSQMINLQTERRGEQFYYLIQHVLARYYLERLSNGLGNIPVVDYSLPIRTGYVPLMSYPNGASFPMRPNNFWMRMERATANMYVNDNYTNSYMYVEDFERRLRDAMDMGYVLSSHGERIPIMNQRGLEILGNMFEGNVESPNEKFYGGLQIFARLFLGNANLMYLQGERVMIPSALEHFATSMRDPIFYQFAKRMLMLMQKYFNNLPPYSMRELLMPLVKIEGMDVSELVTFFEPYSVDISNAVYKKGIHMDMQRIPVRVKQMRLNHKPYTYTIRVNSEKPYNALVKVFLGPKYDEMGRRLEISENYMNFIEIDMFPAELTPGMNYIQRSPLQNYYGSDRTTYRQLYMHVMTSMNRPGVPDFMPMEPDWGMPRRLLLPKGTPKGQIYQMYVMIMPSNSMEFMTVERTSMAWRRSADNTRPLGFPLDRPIDENVFHVPNSWMQDVIITHMEMKTDM